MTAAPVQLSQRDIADGAAHRRRGRRCVLGEGRRAGEPAGVAADRPAHRRAHPDRERPRAGQDHGRPRHRRIHPRRVPPHPVHAGPAAERHHRHPDLRRGDRTRSSPSSGPVHTNIVLLDEINRSSAKTQSAMLEAMEERQTTIAGTVYPIPEPFLVIATQNPVDQEGTYPLSEAQTDRFLLKDVVHTPPPTKRSRCITGWMPGCTTRTTAPGRSSASTTSGALQRRRARRAHGPRADAVRQPPGRRDPRPRQLPAREQLARLIEYGASPRATIAFCPRRARWPCCRGRDHVIPDDIADARAPRAAAPADPRLRGGQRRRHPRRRHRRRAAGGPGALRGADRGQASQPGQGALRHRHPRPARGRPLRAAAHPQPGVRRPAALRAAATTSATSTGRPRPVRAAC